MLLLVLPTTLFAATRSVAMDGSDNGDCLAAPCRTIDHAILRAEAGDIIDVGPGDFGSGLYVTKSVVLRGHQAGVDARGRTGTAETILDAPVFLFADDVALDGFTIGCNNQCSVLVNAQPKRSSRLVNNVLKGGGAQIVFYPAADSRSEVRFNDFIGVKTFVDDLGSFHDTYGLSLGADFGPGDDTPMSMVVDSNRFSGSSRAMVEMSRAIANGSGIDISNNQMTLGLRGRGIALARVAGAHVSANTIAGGGDAAILVDSGSANVELTGNAISGNTFAAVDVRAGVETVKIERNTFLDNTRALALAANAEVHVNRFAGNYIDVNAIGPVTVNADNNWFGCNEGPSRCGRFRADAPGRVDAFTWLVLALSASPDRIAPQRTSIITADLNHNSNGEAVSGFPDGTAIVFNSTGGNLSADHAFTIGGVAQTTFTSNAPGEAMVSAKLDLTETSPLRIVTAQPRRRAANSHE